MLEFNDKRIMNVTSMLKGLQFRQSMGYDNSDR